MTLTLGEQLKIRSMVLVAGEALPYFWPMRNFIHHNPLHGFEHLPFSEAVDEGASLFHARRYLPRGQYQRYLAEGKVDVATLERLLVQFLAGRPAIKGIDQQHLLWCLLTKTSDTAHVPLTVANSEAVYAALHAAGYADKRSVVAPEAMVEHLRVTLKRDLLDSATVYDVVDRLFGTNIGNTLDELLIKGCMDFFDEGQSVWEMPGRDQGLFRAWCEIARRNLRLFLRGLEISNILGQADTAEGIIAYVMQVLGVPEERWMDYFSLELAKLPGWCGFIRWRAHAKDYYWGQRYPADLVDFLAIRLVLALALLQESTRHHNSVITRPELRCFIAERPQEAYLRDELYGKTVLPAFAQRVQMVLDSDPQRRVAGLFADYIDAKVHHEAALQAGRLRSLGHHAGVTSELESLAPEELAQLLDTLAAWEREEGYCWLQAMEAAYIRHLVGQMRATKKPPAAKPPFAQTLFCIDVRSERIRRHLEGIGDYQTFGIAGFFGVPLSFIEFGKGHESHLCPVFVTPKNIVLGLSPEHHHHDEHFFAAAKEVLHDLKNSVLSPYITVEAIGLLFGFDMVGKTIAPRSYHGWRSKLEERRPLPSLLIDNLTRAQARSIIRNMQRIMIIKATAEQLGLDRAQLTEGIIDDLRETALGQRNGPTLLAQRHHLNAEAEAGFMATLRDDYGVHRKYAQLQMERLAKIGFSVDEQANFVARALQSIGLTHRFSRLVLVAGHGSSSENNPYESALDCGACGGDRGLTNARAFAMMANKGEVRERLREWGIDIPSDTWFMPALHNTATDDIELYDLEQMPAVQLAYLPRLRQGLREAGRLTAVERSKELGYAQAQPRAAHKLVRRNAMDWTQVRPEWGLSRNAAFIIGGRELTHNINLDGRAFMHSYDYRQDSKGHLLKTILSGPLVVAQWINMEHYFSTIDNEVYGSGSKVYHNVVSRFAVMSGNLSDIRMGLPAQTVLRGDDPYHEPLRLITFIEAPLSFVQSAINGIANVKVLVNNGWVRVVVVDRDAKSAFVLDRGNWATHPLTDATGNMSAQEMYQ